ncbi:exotoxin [Pseudomonas endophytica]|uniref:Exotoxin n=2 Tax=Pseudomonas endophytica TaxID=1563157 RepID=A0A0Q1CD30_9PSED|nr:exotoxin [Pseudomonas endophytica]
MGQNAQAELSVAIRGTIIAPPACVINSGGILDVPFGDNLMTTQIDGVQYRKPVQYTVVCTGGGSDAMTLTLTGVGAPFDAQSLGTNKTDLGIKLFINGAAWPLNTSVKFTYPVLPALEAVPVKRSSSTLAAGAFSAAATLVVASQ